MHTDPVCLLPILYRAPVDPDQWITFLHKLSEVVPARNAELVARDEQANRYSLMLRWRDDSAVPQDYEDYYAEIVDYAATTGALAGREYNCGNPTPAHELVSGEELARSEPCTAFLLKLGPFRHRIALFGRAGKTLGTLSLRRGKSDPPFGEPDLQVMQLLAPHVQQAIRLDEEFRHLRSQSDAKSQVLDQLHPGVVFLDVTGRVLETHAQAAAILQRADGICVSEGRLKTTDAREDRRLQKTIMQVCHRETEVDCGILLSRRAHAKPLQIVVCPCCTTVAGVRGCPVAVVFMNDMGIGMRPRFELLKELYRLTPAEARLTCLMLDGRSAAEITETLGITRNTLKTQTKSIFAKTNVHRQSQLMRLLLHLPMAHPA